MDSFARKLRSLAGGGGGGGGGGGEADQANGPNGIHLQNEEDLTPLPSLNNKSGITRQKRSSVKQRRPPPSPQPQPRPQQQQQQQQHEPTSEEQLLQLQREYLQGHGQMLFDASAVQRDQALENKVLLWIETVTDESPRDGKDYEHFIQDGSVLSKVMTAIVFNSVPMEDIDQTWGANPSIDRVQAVIREIRRYGVQDVFEAEDLLELRNIPKVTKCLAQLSKLAATDKESLLNCRA